MTDKSNSNTSQVSIFERRVLSCIKEMPQTAKEIREKYILLFPQGLVAKVIVPPASEQKVESGLVQLAKLGLVTKEITRYTDRALKDDTFVYSISPAGRSFLFSKKHH
jgi:hypothetical protein